MGTQVVPWQGTKEVLDLFSRNQGEARREYQDWMANTNDNAENREIERAIRGRSRAVDEGRNATRMPPGEKQSDERILGEGEFVASVLRELEGRDRRKVSGSPRWTPAGSRK